MKLSKYNHIIEKDGYSYWYNGITHMYFRLSNGTGNKLRDNLEDFEAWQETFPAVYSKLVEGGFIIEDDVDEYQIILDRADRAKNDMNAFLIIIPTLNCNYACWYCIQDHIPSMMNEETIERVCHYIDYLIKEEEIESLHIDWFGGEPLMYFDKVIVPIGEYAVKACKEAGIPCSMGATTNAYFLTPEKHAKMRELNFKIFQITLDGNKENHDKVKFMKNLDSSFNRALTNIRDILLDNPNIEVILRINYTHENLKVGIVEEVMNLIPSDIRSRIVILPRKVWQENVDKSYTSELYQILKNFEDAGFRVEYWNPLNYGAPCYASRRLHSTINYQGDIVKCTANDDLYQSDAKCKIGSDGKIEGDMQFFEQYTVRTFDNDRCRDCIYLPNCYGQCPRNWMTNPNGCKMDSDDSEFENAVVKFIDQRYH